MVKGFGGVERGGFFKEFGEGKNEEKRREKIKRTKIYRGRRRCGGVAYWMLIGHEGLSTLLGLVYIGGVSECPETT